MARIEGETSNSAEAIEELFETLSQWNEHLKKEGVDLKEVAPDKHRKRKGPSRGPSPC